MKSRKRRIGSQVSLEKICIDVSRLGMLTNCGAAFLTSSPLCALRNNGRHAPSSPMSPRAFQHSAITAALLLGLEAAMAARPEPADFDKVTGIYNTTNFECDKHTDCPSSWGCFNDDGKEVAPPLTPGPGHCDCYVTFGGSGSDCQDRNIPNATWFSVTSMGIFLVLCYLLGSLNIIFFKLHSAKAFSMKKASNIAFLYLYAAIFGIALYQISAFMASTNTGSFELWVDMLRPLGVGEKRGQGGAKDQGGMLEAKRRSNKALRI